MGNDYLQTLLSTQSVESDKLIPWIKRFLWEHPYAGTYTVVDEKYENKCKSPETMHFHPSTDCTKCPRLLYFERSSKYSKKLVDNITADTQAIFKLGSCIHAMIQAWFMAWNDMEGYPTCIGNERRIEDEELNIGGYIDSMIRFPNDDDDVVIEIKSISSYQFGLLRTPKPEHRLQVATYLMETGAKYGIVLYYNKDTSEMKEFRVEPMDMMPTLMKWGKVRQAIKDKSIAGLECGCSFDEKDKAFKYCPAKGFCQSVH